MKWPFIFLNNAEKRTKTERKRTRMLLPLLSEIAPLVCAQGLSTTSIERDKSVFSSTMVS